MTFATVHFLHVKFCFLDEVQNSIFFFWMCRRCLEVPEFPRAPDSHPKFFTSLGHFWGPYGVPTGTQSFSPSWNIWGPCAAPRQGLKFSLSWKFWGTHGTSLWGLIFSFSCDIFVVWQSHYTPLMPYIILMAIYIEQVYKLFFIVFLLYSAFNLD